MGKPGVDEVLGKRVRIVDGGRQRFGSAPVKDVGGVAALGQCNRSRRDGVLGEQPVGAFGGGTAGGVGVGGDDRFGVERGEEPGLGFGE